MGCHWVQIFPIFVKIRLLPLLPLFAIKHCDITFGVLSNEMPHAMRISISNWQKTWYGSCSSLITIFCGYAQPTENTRECPAAPGLNSNETPFKQVVKEGKPLMGPSSSSTSNHGDPSVAQLILFWPPCCDGCPIARLCPWDKQIKKSAFKNKHILGFNLFAIPFLHIIFESIHFHTLLAATIISFSIRPVVDKRRWGAGG